MSSCPTDAGGDPIHVGETVQILAADVTHRVTGPVDDPGTEPLTLTATVVPPSGPAPVVSTSSRSGDDVWVTFVPLVAGWHTISVSGNGAGAVFRSKTQVYVESWP
jgi:hypothetical protein